MIHSSWIEVPERLPENNKEVSLLRVTGEWNFTEWLSVGKYRELAKNWVIKKAIGLTLDNSKPTHWWEL